MPVAVPLPSHFDAKSVATVALDSSGNADRNSLSGRRHVHDAVLIIFQVKPSIMKSKPTMNSNDIKVIKNLEKLKCQQIVSFHYNQKLPLESTFLVGQELYTNYTELLPKRFITSESRKQGHYTIMGVCCSARICNLLPDS